MSGKALLFLYRGDDLTLFVSANHPPADKRFTRKKMKELGGKGLKERRTKKGSVFSFKAQGKVFWLSTNGGYLMAETDKLTNKKYRALRNRVHRSFK